MKSKNKKSKDLMRLNKFLSNRKVLITIVVVCSLCLFLMCNYVVNFFMSIPSYARHEITNSEFFSAKHIFPQLKYLFRSKGWTIIFVIELIFIAVFDALLIYRIKIAYSQEHINVGQKGDRRFTTIKEIKEQYKEIPDKDEFYEGFPGIPISHYGDKLYIDTSPSHTMGIGITRGGKGEYFVFTSIDVNSRAEHQASMVLIDMKFELYKSTKETLKKRGYVTRLLNLVDLVDSMGYNPFTEIIKVYKEGKEDEAELLAQTFAASIYTPDQQQGDNKFFANTSVSVLSAFIIANVEDSLTSDEIANYQRLKQWKAKRKAFIDLKENEPDMINEVKKKYEEMKEIYGDMVMLQPNLLYIPDTEEFTYSTENEKKITVYGIISAFTEMATMPYTLGDNPLKTYIDEFFEIRPALDRAKLKFIAANVSGERTKGNIYSNMLSELKTFAFKNVAKMTAESSIDLREVGFGEKPYAIFIGMSFHDKSNWSLANIFITQLFYVLSSECVHGKGKCDRQVRFIVDEAGNMPAIDSLDSLVTVGGGQNMFFDFWIQSYTQFYEKYGDNKAKTIIGNCANQIYILSNDEDTTTFFSKQLGNETILDLQRTGEKLDLSKTFLESTMEHPLLSPSKLMELHEGENVIHRVIKRRDLKRNHIKPMPIFNSIETGTSFLPRYEHLADIFPDPDKIDLDDVIEESRDHINVLERVWDFRESQDLIEAKSSGLILYKTIADMSSLRKKEFIEILKECYGKKYKKVIKITDETSLAKAYIKICDSDISSDKKEKLTGLISQTA